MAPRAGGMAMSGKTIRAGHRRTILQRFVTDPLTGIFVLILWYVFKGLPVGAASALGAGLGTLMGLVMRGKNKVAYYNLQKCLPELGPAAHRRIVRDMWRHFGRMMGELPHGDDLVRAAQITGAEHLRAAAADKHGCFFCSAHLGNWELYGALTKQYGFPLHLVYRAANNPWAEKLLYQRRQLNGIQLIPKGTEGARRMIELLKQGEHVGILCDQKMREGPLVPFFGFPARTAPAIAQLAYKLELPIYPARSVRLKGARYHIEVLPPLDLPKTGNKEDDVLAVLTQINALIEKWIREHPEQWLWIHRRFAKEEYRTKKS